VIELSQSRSTLSSSKTFNCYRVIGNYQMYEVLDDTAAQTILAIESGDSIRRVAQHLHTPYETVRQAVNRLEDAGYVSYDDGLTVVDERVRDAARELVAASAGVSPPSIEETYAIPQFSDWPFAFTRIDAVYVWTQGGYQVGREPDDYPLFLAVREQDVDAWETFFESFDLPTAFERQPQDELDGPLQIVLEPRASLDIEHVEGYPVIREQRQSSICARTTPNSSRGWRCSTGCTRTSTSASRIERPNGRSHELQQPK